MAEELEHRGFSEEELEDLVEKVYNFTELFCFPEPDTQFYPYQEQTAKAIIRDVLGNLGNTITGLFSRQSGKSETVANVAAALMIILPKLAALHSLDENGRKVWAFPSFRQFRQGFKVGIFAPSNLQSTTTYKRLRDRLTAIGARIFLDSPEFAKEGDDTLRFISNTGIYIELSNGSFCLQMSADKQSKIESKTFDLILLDESQDLDAFVVGKSINPMGAATNATKVATGTPGTTKGFFYNQIETNKTFQLDRKRVDRKIQPQLHFEYDYKTVQKYNPNYKKYVAKERRDIGEESDEFKMAYELVWLLERGMAVSQELFNELSRKDLNIQTSLKGVELVAGLDWGKSEDSTVLTIGKPHWEDRDEEGNCPVEVVYWWEKLGDNYEIIFDELKEQIKRYSIRTISCDATGVGEPLVSRLAVELPLIHVVPVKFSSQQKDHLYKFFMLMLQERKCWWPGHFQVKSRKYFKHFESQMTNLVKEYKNGYLACHAPEDQRNAHDDFPDSLALMLWCIKSEAMPYVDVTLADDMYRNNNWHKWQPGNRFSLR